MSNRCLIIFYRNPEPGKVKTRLAATLGDEAALAIYWKLAAHTSTVVEELDVDKIVYYSHFVDEEDHWIRPNFDKALQDGVDLGARMSHAFKEAFKRGYQKVCVIGTDCLELTTEIVKEAYESLSSTDVVIGPALDGGYYLLGMKKFILSLFENKAWSTDSVFDSTIADLNRSGYAHAILTMLRDVDEESDLPEGWQNYIKK